MAVAIAAGGDRGSGPLNRNKRGRRESCQGCKLPSTHPPTHLPAPRVEPDAPSGGVGVEVVLVIIHDLVAQRFQKAPEQYSIVQRSQPASGESASGESVSQR